MTDWLQTAEQLQIAGLTPMSTVDWPGRIVATVFTQGCPWACSYCHNHAILDPRIPGTIAWQSVADLMKRRHGLLDGVVFSGGEATRQCALLPAMRAVKNWGYEVGLHTAGPYPTRLRDLLSEGLADWVGLDIKTLPGAGYDALAGRPNAGQRAWESLNILMANPPAAYEVRMTVDATNLAYVEDVARGCFEAGVRHFVIQEVRTLGAPTPYQERSATLVLRREHLARLYDQVTKLGFETLTLRPAH